MRQEKAVGKMRQKMQGEIAEKMGQEKRKKTAEKMGQEKRKEIAEKMGQEKQKETAEKMGQEKQKKTAEKMRQEKEEGEAGKMRQKKGEEKTGKMRQEKGEEKNGRIRRERGGERGTQEKRRGKKPEKKRDDLERKEEREYKRQTRGMNPGGEKGIGRFPRGEQDRAWDEVQSRRMTYENKGEKSRRISKINTDIHADMIEERTADKSISKAKGKPMDKLTDKPTDKAAGRKLCSHFGKCGGCQLLFLSYEEQLRRKERFVQEQLSPFCRMEPIVGMESPMHYRNKVHAVFDRDRKGNPISGVYEAGSHKVVPVDSCLLDDERADAIIVTIRSLLKSFKIKTYDEDTEYGLLRHVLIRTGHISGEILVVLVTASPVFPSRNNFVKVLRERHPEITTIVQNINERGTSMVLGKRDVTLFGKGYIEDTLCGKTFRISPQSFYQINSLQTEKLYRRVLDYAKLTGKETVLDAYCGIGTIGIIASEQAKKVIGVELNPEAVKDAEKNAHANGVENIEFYQNDAGEFMKQMAARGEKLDVLFMDPPRSGSSEEFLDAVGILQPKKIVYVSCNVTTQVRDIKILEQKGYRGVRGVGVDMFPATEHVECVVLMSRVEK